MNWFDLTVPSTTAEIKSFQEKSLQAHLQYVQKHSPFYSRLFKQNNIDVTSIRTKKDLALIPPTEKQDLQLYNNDFICVSEDKIIDYVTTSGTLGEPVTFVLTDNDLKRLAYNEYTSLRYAGISSSDKVQLTVTLDRRFMAGLAYFSGLRKIGAGIIRVGPGNLDLQWDTILRIKPTVLIAVPSFLLQLLEFAKEKGIGYKSSSIKKVICIGDAIRNQDFSLNELSKKILQDWPLALHSTYASTEMGTAFTECSHGRGGHVIPQLIIVECLDENNNPVPEGTPGELVVTPLGVEGMPLVRFKTGDITVLYKEQCLCGSTAWRISPILGRKNHMIKYKGTTLYPQSLNDILNVIEAVDSYFIEAYTNEFGADELVANIFTTQYSEGVEKKIKDTFRAKLRVTPLLKFVSKEEVEKVKFPAGSRKPVYFVDRRLEK